MANNILEMKKHKMQVTKHVDGSQVQWVDYGGDALRGMKDEDFDPKIWRWSQVIFYIILIGVVAGLLAWKEANACDGEEPKPMEPIKMVRGI